MAIRITINGKVAERRDGMTLADLVLDLELAGKPIAIERNLEVVSRARFEGTRLQEGDRIEIVSLVGGG